MTEYIVFRYDSEDDSWEKYATREASSGKRAIAAAEVSAGQYAAVPKRSWQPLTVKVENTVKVTIG